MSLAVMLQGLGWVSVIWLVTVHVMIRRGRLMPHGPAYQVAGSVAAASVVGASVAEELWPVAVLGLLWLRIEVFGHRHPAGDRRAAGEHVPASMPSFLVGALDRGRHVSPGHSTASRPSTGRPEHPEHADHPHHLPHPHLGPRAVDVLFKIEMAVVIGIAFVLFVIWSAQQRESFGNDTNKVLCHWMREC